MLTSSISGGIGCSVDTGRVGDVGSDVGTGTDVCEEMSSESGELVGLNVRWRFEGLGLSSAASTSSARRLGVVSIVVDGGRGQVTVTVAYVTEN